MEPYHNHNAGHRRLSSLAQKKLQSRVKSTSVKASRSEGHQNRHSSPRILHPPFSQPATAPTTLPKSHPFASSHSTKNTVKQPINNSTIRQQATNNSPSSISCLVMLTVLSIHSLRPITHGWRNSSAAHAYRRALSLMRAQFATTLTHFIIPLHPHTTIVTTRDSLLPQHSQLPTPTSKPSHTFTSSPTLNLSPRFQHGPMKKEGKRVVPFRLLHPRRLLRLRFHRFFTCLLLYSHALTGPDCLACSPRTFITSVLIS